MAENEKKVIVTIDDDPIILNKIVSVLKDTYTIRPFTSGEVALKFLENNSADLILLDCNMPEMAGFEVLAILQESSRLKSIPVIFLTASVDGDDEITALDNGAMDYLLKPIKNEQLLKRVSLQLELQGYRTHLEKLVEEKTDELVQANKKLREREQITLDLLARAGDMRDHDTGEHIIRTVSYVRIIAQELVDNPNEGYNISATMAEEIAEASKLHDLGKIAMPDNVLLKPGKLTKEEFDIIKTHPVHGAQMLDYAVEKMGDDNLIAQARNIALGHHEKWDGNGYPRGLAGGNIPLSARIAAIADVFDALTSERPYKKAFSPKDAFDILYNDAGTHFDPYLIEIVKKHEKEFCEVRGIS